MKVGVNCSPALKEKSQELSLPFADLLRGYLVEDFLGRVYESPFCENLWLINEDAIGVEHYVAKQERPLLFFYAESGKRMDETRMIPGQKLSPQLMNVLEEAILQKRTDVIWRIEQENGADFFGLQLEGEFCDMKVPLYVRIQRISMAEGRPTKREFLPFMDPSRRFPIYIYARENRLGEYLYEIVKKLELISDMGPYDAVNQILKSEPVSGRHILEKLQQLSEGEPQVRREKRLEQLEEYLDYTYMRKRWQQYERVHRREPEPWEDVMARVLCFLRPTWGALCRNEIFFDDWMPELGRFLG
ncbi:MAG: hypothetical protein PUB52_06525 [Lachnospiraceae bacterium]|nr:hypothetical protein [Lachnospiraceae bacterium]